MGFPLYSFPDEIVLYIFEFVSEVDDLFNAALVDRRMNALAEPHLYSNVQLLDDKQANTVANALVRKNERAPWIKRLLVSLNFGEHEGLDRLPPLMRLMTQLQDLRLETPDCNHKEPALRVPWVLLQERYERLFQSSSLLVPKSSDRYLQSLQTCVIHLVDAQTELYLLSKYPTLFLHPCLKSLTLSCSSTDSPKAFLPKAHNEFARSTALEHLHLEECDFHPRTLATILRLPRALKSLKLSEGVRYSNLNNFHERKHGNLSPESLVHALREQVDSLEFISLSLGHYRGHNQNINGYDEHLDLREFTALKRLETSFRTLTLVQTTPCDHSFWRRLPAQLETLRVFDMPTGIARAILPLRGISAAPPFPFQPCLVERKVEHGLRDLKMFICAYSVYGLDDEMETDIDSGEEEGESIRLRRLKDVLKARARLYLPLLKKADLQLRIDLVGLPRGFIPPYLFKERSPIDTVLWDSALDTPSTDYELSDSDDE